MKSAKYPLLCLVGFTLLTIACHAAALTISQTGATATDTTDYYIIKIPAESENNVDIVITAGGSAPLEENDDICECKEETTNPEIDDGVGPVYTFSYDAGTQDKDDSSKINWSIDSSIVPGIYKFKVTKLSQEYSCPDNYTGGSLTKENNTASPEITILAVRMDSETFVGDPDNDSKERKRLGVGEYVTVSLSPSSAKGTWSVGGGSTYGTVLTTHSVNETTYIAPDWATMSTVQCSIKGVVLSKGFEIVRPESLSSTKTRENYYSWGAGTQGVIMELKITWHPTDVSFMNVIGKELPGPPSDIRGGYFTDHTPPNHDTADWVTVSSTNTTADEAGFWNCLPPWEYGSYTWDIPVRYKVYGATIERSNIANRIQIHTIVDSTGKSKVEKLDSQAIRTP